jgi:DNA-binding NarL/FixJ family response regulator
VVNKLGMGEGDKVIRIAIIDDQPIMIQGLSMILSGLDDMEVVGTGINGEEAIELISKTLVDVFLMDIRMPVMDGVEATKRIKEIKPDIKILILTTFNDDAYIFDTLRSGASGYLLKDAAPEQIVDAIHTVYKGGTLINPDSATKMVERLKDDLYKVEEKDSRISELTKRELDICHYLAEGKNNKEIADILFISEATFKNNITRILDKLELRDRTQLALFAVKNDL